MSSFRTDALFGVEGRVAVVTGGCSGLGLMISKVSMIMCIFLFSHNLAKQLIAMDTGSCRKWRQGIRRGTALGACKRCSRAAQ